MLVLRMPDWFYSDCFALNEMATTVHIVHTKGPLQYCFKNDIMTALVHNYHWIIANSLDWISKKINWLKAHWIHQLSGTSYIPTHMEYCYSDHICYYCLPLCCSQEQLFVSVLTAENIVRLTDCIDCSSYFLSC